MDCDGNNSGLHVSITGPFWQHEHTCLLQSSVSLLCGVTEDGENCGFLKCLFTFGEINLKHKIFGLTDTVRSDICFLESRILELESFIC